VKTGLDTSPVSSTEPQQFRQDAGSNAKVMEQLQALVTGGSDNE
jgi:hypothetical protein